jgi:hypothetical protein
MEREQLILGGDADVILNETGYSITQSNYIGKVAKIFSVNNAIPILFKNWIWAQIVACGISVIIYYLNRRRYHDIMQ